MNNKIWLFVAGVCLLGMGLTGGMLINKKPEVLDEKDKVSATVTPVIKEVTVTPSTTSTPTVTPTSTPTTTPTLKPQVTLIKINPNVLKLLPSATPTLVKIVVPSVKINIPKW